MNLYTPVEGESALVRRAKQAHPLAEFISTIVKGVAGMEEICEVAHHLLNLLLDAKLQKETTCQKTQKPEDNPSTPAPAESCNTSHTSIYPLILGI